MSKVLKNNILFHLVLVISFLSWRYLSFLNISNLEYYFFLIDIDNLDNIWRALLLNEFMISAFILSLYFAFLFIFSRVSFNLNLKRNRSKQEISLNKLCVKYRWVLPVVLVVLISVVLVKGNFDIPVLIDGTKKEKIEFKKTDELLKIKINTLGQSLPTAKGDGDIPVLVMLEEESKFTYTYGTIKVQGSSTAIWPKKNWTVKLYSDQARENPVLLKVGDSIFSDYWIAKAEWIDPSLLRNMLSYRLWGDMVNSRTGSLRNEVLNAFDDGEQIETDYGIARGYPYTHPVHLAINNEHYGISTLTLGHDPNNFNIDKENLNHIYMEFDARGGYTAKKTWDKFSADGIGSWIEGYYPKDEDFSQEHKQAMDRLGAFINSTNGLAFKADFNNYLDKENMIDMFLYLEVLYDLDAVAQDIEMVTYNLERWYFLPWDKDTTFGLGWDNTGLFEDSEKAILLAGEVEAESKRPWLKLYKAFKPEIEERYAELRENGVFTVKNLERRSDEIYKMIPEELWEAERNRWDKEGRLSTDDIGREQILDWFTKRLKVLDEHFGYIKE